MWSRNETQSRRAAAAEHAGNRLERAAGQPQLTRAVDLRWLARTCSIRVVPDRGNPKTNTGLARRAGAESRANKSRSKARTQPVDESLVIGRRVVLAVAIGFERQRVALAEAFGGPCIFALAIQRVGQRKKKPAARAFDERVVFQTLFERGQVGFGQLGAQQGRQPGVRQR